jgi:DNA-binding MarR family transcriptional regulator
MRLKHSGITTAQYTVLRCINENKGLNQVKLARLISTNANNSSSLIKRLNKQGLIRKKTILNDRRNSIIEMTPKGESLFRNAEKLATALQAEILNLLPPDSEEQLFHLLSKCTENLDD